MQSTIRRLRFLFCVSLMARTMRALSGHTCLCSTLPMGSEVVHLLQRVGRAWCPGGLSCERFAVPVVCLILPLGTALLAGQGGPGSAAMWPVPASLHAQGPTLPSGAVGASSALTRQSWLGERPEAEGQEDREARVVPRCSPVLQTPRLHLSPSPVLWSSLLEGSQGRGSDECLRRPPRNPQPAPEELPCAPGPVWARCVEPEPSLLLWLSGTLCPRPTPEVSPVTVPADPEWCLSVPASLHGGQAVRARERVQSPGDTNPRNRVSGHTPVRQTRPGFVFIWLQSCLCSLSLCVGPSHPSQCFCLHFCCLRPSTSCAGSVTSCAWHSPSTPSLSCSRRTHRAQPFRLLRTWAGRGALGVASGTQEAPGADDAQPAQCSPSQGGAADPGCALPVRTGLPPRTGLRLCLWLWDSASGSRFAGGFVFINHVYMLLGLCLLD